MLLAEMKCARAASVLFFAFIIAVCGGCHDPIPPKPESERLIGVAMTAHHRRDYDAALRACDEAIRFDPKYVLGYRVRGMILTAQNDFDRLFVNGVEWGEIEPDAAEAFEMRASAREGQQRFADAAVEMTGALRHKPDRADWLGRRAWMQWRAGNLSEAAADYAVSVRLDPQNSEPYFSRGVFLFETGSPDQALDDFKKAAGMNGRSKKVYFWLGRAYFDRKDYARAIDEFNVAIQLDDQDIDAYLLRSKAFKELRRFDEAIADLTAALKLRYDPNLIVARGMLYAFGIDSDLALKDFSTVIEFRPEDPEPRVLRGVIYMTKEDYRKAARDFDEAVRLKPDYVSAYRHRAEARMGLLQFYAAAADLTVVLRSGPDAKLYFQRGQCYFVNKQFEKAVDDFTQWIDLEPSNGEAFLCRSMAYEGMKEKAKAEADVRRAHELGASGK